LIIITGEAVARPDTIDQLLALSLEHVHRSRKEPGCLSHDVFVEGENPLRLFFFETWADRDAVKVHFAVPESRAFVVEAGKLTDGPPSLKLYEAEPAEL
jgi:quinol monooxygenase YgiN